MGRADTAVRSGKALYRHFLLFRRTDPMDAISCSGGWARRCSSTSRPNSMLNRWIEGGLLDVLGREGVGCIASPRWPRAC